VAPHEAVVPGELDSESSLQVPSSALEVVSSELDMDKMNDEDMWCNFFSRQKLKTYYFEIMSPGGERIAMKLTRHAESPKLLIAKDQAWSVAWNNTEEKVDWELVGPKDVKLPAEDTVEVDLVSDVASIRRVQETDENGTALPDMIEIIYRDGGNFSFVGGTYYPKRLMKKWLSNPKNSEFTESDSASELRHDLHAVKEVTVGGVVKEIAKSTLLGAVLGSVMLTSQMAIEIGPEFYQVMKAIKSWFPGSEVWAQIPQLAVFWTIGVALLGMMFVTAVGTLTLGTAISGAGAGALAAVPVAALKVIVTSFLAIRKKHKELAMDASEKLFSKLRCHRSFKECDEEGNIFVPKDLDCPSSQSNISLTLPQ